MVSERLLPRYYWYQAVSAATFFQAVFFVYYGECAGLSVATILALQSFNTGLRAALDLPFGALADRVSRRLCLVGASLGNLAGAALLLAWPSLPGACIAETCFAVAAALRSGADSALLHDTLRADGRIAINAEISDQVRLLVKFGYAQQSDLNPLAVLLNDGRM